MSRSIHKTKKGVFKGKSKKEIRKMIEESDEDVQDLQKKKKYKKIKRETRKSSYGPIQENIADTGAYWSILKGALENENFKWRTVSGIKADTGLSTEQIFTLLNLHSEEIIKSSIPAKDGQSLFATRNHYRKKSSIWNRIENSILNKVAS